MSRINVFAGGELDRAAPLRDDADWVATMRAHSDSRYVALWRGQCLLTGEVEPTPVFLSREAVEAATADDAADDAAEDTVVALLGIDGDIATFAVDLSAHDADPAEGALAGAGAFFDLRDYGGLMTAPDASLLAQARGLIYWHQRHRFCGVCGSAAMSRDAGHLRRCTNPDCATDHFPRTDPAVIMLVADGDYCLMGRQAEWPDGLYSTLAGFVEPGESLEEAVARETWEEAGIRVRDVRYHSSQPWPFPGSLMLGFYADAATTDITINSDELDDVRWFHRDELRNPDNGTRLPRPISISRLLVDDWLAGDPSITPS